MDQTRKRAFKNEIFDQLALIGKALANGRRLELLDLLAQSERTVESLAREIRMSVAGVSLHLKVLREARLIEVRREGSHAHYRLAGSDVFSLWRAVRELGDSRIAEVRRTVQTYLTDRQSLQAITCSELARRLNDRGLFVLDVRPTEEYEAGHILGARSIPMSELKARLREIPRRSVVIAYCRGPYCVFADEAVATLHHARRKAMRLDSGFPDWKACGLPVDAKPPQTMVYR